MLPDKSNSVNRSIKSFSYAWKGFIVAFKTQINFKIQILFASFVVVMAFVFKFTLTEWVVLLIVITLVLITELINTAIETITDHLFPGFHHTAGKIKDISAAAVLIAALAAIITGLLLFLPKII